MPAKVVMKAGIEHSNKVFTVFGITFQEVDKALMLQQSQDFRKVHAFSDKFAERMLLHNASFADVSVKDFDASGWNE